MGSVSQSTEASIGLDELLSFADEIPDTNEPQAAAQVPSSEGNDGFDSEDVSLLSTIGMHLADAMSVELTDMDLNDDEHQEIMFTIFDKVLKAMKKKGNKELDEMDFAYVKQRIETEAVKRGLQQPHATKRRFAPLDRVVCRIDRDEREWAAGSVQALDVENDDVDPYKTFPYMTKIDAPGSFGFSVPEDTNAWVRSEVCFGQRADALLWTLRCLPRAKTRGGCSRGASRRFQVGERVACAVEAADGDYTDWAPGTVIAVDHSVEGIGGLVGGIVPYQVAMDGGEAATTTTVLVHRDEHWLVRDLALQEVGPRIASDGTRVVKRMGKRKLGDDLWQVVDHVTRKVRKLEVSDDDDDD